VKDSDIAYTGEAEGGRIRYAAWAEEVSYREWWITAFRLETEYRPDAKSRP